MDNPPDVFGEWLLKMEGLGEVASMPGYLVRLIDTRDLGFFVAETMNDLLAAVDDDECTDAKAREHARLPAGGIMWEIPAARVPIEIDIPQVPWSAAELTESWFDVLDGYTEGHWLPLFPDAPCQPRPPTPRRPLGRGEWCSSESDAD